MTFLSQFKIQLACSDSERSVLPTASHLTHFFFSFTQFRILLILVLEEVSHTLRDGQLKVNDLFLYLWSRWGLPS